MNDVSKLKLDEGCFTQGMVDAAIYVFKCKAWEETVRPIVRAYQTEILAKRKFKPCAEMAEFLEGDVIIEQKDSYLMSDSDFHIYMDDCYMKEIEHGFFTPTKQHCPLLIAEGKTREAQRKLVDIMAPLTGITQNVLLQRPKGLDTYREYIELTLRVLVKHIPKDSVIITQEDMQHFNGGLELITG